MFFVTVKDRIMIAHSLPSAVFGPAQGMHGATYEVLVTFFSEEMDNNNLVIDMGVAHKILNTILKSLNFKNLDEQERFQGSLTTTEFLSKFIWDEVVSNLNDLQLIHIKRLKVELLESSVASAGFEDSITR